MSKVSNFFGKEFIWFKDYFLRSKRGPLFLIILIVVAIPLAALYSQQQLPTSRIIQSQISDDFATYSPTCTNGTWTVTFNTQQDITAGGIDYYYIDIERQDNGDDGNFSDGQFIGAGPFTTDAPYAWSGIEPNVPIYWRVNSHFPDGHWNAGPTRQSSPHACPSGNGGGETTAGTPPGCGITARAAQPAGQKDCPGGDIIDSQTGNPLCGDNIHNYNFTGTYNEEVCGSNGKGYKCNGNTGIWDENPNVKTCGPSSGGTTTGTPPGCGITARAAQPAGQKDCPGGDIINADSGAPMCGTAIHNYNFTGTYNETVCGSDKKEYKCNGTNSLWEATGKPCGPNSGGTGGGGGGTSPTGTTIPTTTVTTVPSPSVTTTVTTSPSPATTITTTTSPSTAPSTSPSTAPSGTVANTNIAFTLAVDGVGNNTGSGQNNSPTPNPMKVQLQIFDGNNNKVAETSADATYDPTSGAFKGKVPVTISTGAYTIKARFDNTLWKKVVKTLTAGVDNDLPYAKLINGDLNQDNKLDLLDYNAMLSCLKGNCSSHADLNLDGKVNALDTNLLYYHFKNREGD